MQRIGITTARREMQIKRTMSIISKILNLYPVVRFIQSLLLYKSELKQICLFLFSDSELRNSINI